MGSDGDIRNLAAGVGYGALFMLTFFVTLKLCDKFHLWGWAVGHV